MHFAMLGHSQKSHSAAATSRPWASCDRARRCSLAMSSIISPSSFWPWVVPFAPLPAFWSRCPCAAPPAPRLVALHFSLASSA
eukprot:2610874-Pyramimonas_sp.AAC.1